MGRRRGYIQSDRAKIPTQYRGPGFKCRRASKDVVSPTSVEHFQSKFGEPVPGALEQPRSVGGHCEVSGVGATAKQ